MKLATKIATAITAAALAALTPVAANATDTPPAEQYKTFVWEMQEGSTADEPFLGGTQYLLHVSDELDEPDNTVFDEQLVQNTCEWTGYQVDVYRYTTDEDRAAVDALEEYGYLVEYGDPVKEPHAGPHNQGVYIKKVIYDALWQSTDPSADCFTGPERPEPKLASEDRQAAPVCIADGIAEVVAERRDGSAQAEWNGSAWVYGDMVWGEWQEVARDQVASEGCDVVTPEPTPTPTPTPTTPTPEPAPSEPAVTPAPTETPTAAPVVDNAEPLIPAAAPAAQAPAEKLAATGVNATLPLAAGALLLAAGIALAVGRTIRRKA